MSRDRPRYHDDGDEDENGQYYAPAPRPRRPHPRPHRRGSGVYLYSLVVPVLVICVCVQIMYTNVSTFDGGCWFVSVCLACPARATQGSPPHPTPPLFTRVGSLKRVLLAVCFICFICFTCFTCFACSIQTWAKWNVDDHEGRYGVTSPRKPLRIFICIS